MFCKLGHFSLFGVGIAQTVYLLLPLFCSLKMQTAQKSVTLCARRVFDRKAHVFAEVGPTYLIANSSTTIVPVRPIPAEQ